MAQRPSQPPNKGPRSSRPTPNPLEFIDRNRKVFSLLNLVAAIFLVYFAINGFLQGLVFTPFGFGLLGLYFFYAYARIGLRIDFGKIGVILNMVLLLGALLCLVIGLSNQN